MLWGGDGNDSLDGGSGNGQLGGDKYFKPQPHDASVWTNPLTGKSKGWPVPRPDAIVYLKRMGIRCVATDAPDLGGVADPAERSCCTKSTNKRRRAF
jgi:Ca2+-binding RTX toxin-like protein